MASVYEYSEQGGGGIGYRLDIRHDTGPRKDRWISYTTNPDGSGLFYHNGLGNRQQIRGNGQFAAQSMRQFKARTATILKSHTEPESLDG